MTCCHFPSRLFTNPLIRRPSVRPFVLRSPHLCESTDWWCYRRAESDSTGTELRHTSWLGCRTAACADSGRLLAGEQIISSSFPLAPFPNRPHSVSVCGQTLESKPNLLPLLIASSVPSPLSSPRVLTRSPGFQARRNRPPDTDLEGKHYLCPSSCPALPHLRDL